EQLDSSCDFFQERRSADLRRVLASLIVRCRHPLSPLPFRADLATSASKASTRTTSLQTKAARAEFQPSGRTFFNGNRSSLDMNGNTNDELGPLVPDESTTTLST